MCFLITVPNMTWGLNLIPTPGHTAAACHLLLRSTAFAGPESLHAVASDHAATDFLPKNLCTLYVLAT